MDQEEIDQVCTELERGRAEMRAAFAGLSGRAQLLGADEDTITQLHGQFFDGSDQVRAQVRKLALLARLNGGT